MSKFRNAQVKFLYAFSTPEELEKFFETEKNTRGLSFIGRSNVGKSSLINSIFGKNTARTSKTPGRTQSVIIFEVSISEKEKFFVYDLPGYGYAKVSKEQKRQWDLLLKSFFSLIGLDVLLLCIQDARHPFQNADLGFLEFRNEYELNSILLFNKIDKLKTQKERSQLLKTKKKMLYESDLSQIFDVSAEKRTGVNELERFILDFIRI